MDEIVSVLRDVAGDRRGGFPRKLNPEAIGKLAA
jgi:hypothetical protein